MKKIGKIILKILEIAIIIYVILISTVLLCRNKFGYTQFGEHTIVTMGQKATKYLTNFDKKDLLVFDSIDVSDVKVGTEVYYYAVENEKYVIKYGKILEKTGETSDALYKIEGNGEKDISNEKVIGTLEKTYGGIGQILFFLSSRIGFLIFVLLPILVLFIYEIYDFVMDLKYEKVEPTKKKEKEEETKHEDIETL